MTNLELQEKIETLKNLLVARATGGNDDDGTYGVLRRELMGDPRVRELLPRFVRTCRNLQEFWGVIKAESETYQGRRDFLRDASDHG